MSETLAHVNALSEFLTNPAQLAVARDEKALTKNASKFASKNASKSVLIQQEEIDMRAKEIMHKGVKTIDENATLETAAHTMKDSDIGVLPVVSGSKVVGVLTDRDIVTRCLAEDKDYHKVHVSDCMSRNVVCASENAELEDISNKMKESKISRVFVEDSKHQPIGLISVEDFAHNSNPKLFAETISAIKS